MTTALSIITPCYNGEHFIAEAVSSVLAQNRQDIEMIVVDDGSVDDSAKICRVFEGETVQYIRSENRGAGNARNLGLNRAAGRWIAFLDADDLYLPGVMDDSFFRKLEEYEKSGTDIVFTPYVKADMALKEHRIVPAQQPHEVEHHLFRNEMWSCLYRREFLEKNGIRFYEYQKQDIETAFRYKACAAAGKIVTDDSMMFCLQRNNLMSNTHTWNHYNLYHIKAKVYLDLARTTRHPEDVSFLLDQVRDMLLRYWKLCVRHGYLSEEMHREMRQLLKETSEGAGGKTGLIQAGWFAAGLRRAKLPPKKQTPPPYRSNVPETMQNLRYLKEKLREEKDQ